MNTFNLEKEQISEKGITLIALVITIIVLLILVAISIATLTGENGILTKADTARNATEMNDIIERARVNILEVQTDNQSGDITKSQFIEILNKYFNDVPTAEELPEDLSTLTLTTKSEYGSHNIKISDIWNGTFKQEKTPVDVAQTYVGYYADIEGDGIVDGVIYADLAKGNTGDGRWNDGKGDYEIPIETGTKNYYVSQAKYKGDFGIKDVLLPMGEGKERFYIMALEDFNKGTSYNWYYAASGKLDNSGDKQIKFGAGKDLTATMIAKWNVEEYGKQDACAEGHKDLWGAIKKEVANGWFVPSRVEWSAFAEELGINRENYKATFRLSGQYLTSSVYDSELVYTADFVDSWPAGLTFRIPNAPCTVRLVTTF